MKRSRTFLLTILALILSTSLAAHGQDLRFQRPSQSRQALGEQKTNQNFQAPNAPFPQTSTPAPLPAPAPRLAQRSIKLPASRPAPIRLVQQVPELAEGEEVKRPAPQGGESVEMPSPMELEMGGVIDGMEVPCEGCNMCPGDCCCEIGCGIADCCGSGVCEPQCGCAEPCCGCADPSCGCEVGCGSCVGLPGPDYICFPVCIPRFKDLSFWAGVHGFRGPRDFYDPGSAVPGSRSDSNFGFQEGVNVSGRAPFLGLLFPQLSYQVGYQVLQSRLSGTVEDSEDRNQQFVTAGLFRNVTSGLQFGAVWDLMRDDLYVEEDFHQVRYEVSLKSPVGREIGFWGASATNSKEILNIEYEAVDQFNLFYRCDFGKSSSARIWGGLTGESEGIFGGEFITPLNDRWSVQSGFNYLIPDADEGLAGVTQESWNVGINLVWHLGRTARSCCRSPYRPMFSVADNGWMFIDREGSFNPNL